DHLVHGCRAVLDADHHRRAAAAVHRRPAGHRGAFGASTIAAPVAMTAVARPAGHNGAMDEARPLVELTGATVRFGADAALDDVSFRMFSGEVHSLMGENGAGKSTLIKAITGALPLDAGLLVVDGRAVSFATPHDAQRAGISTVYQE